MSVRGASAAISREMHRRLVGDGTSPLAEDALRTWLSSLTKAERRVFNLTVLLIDGHVTTMDLAHSILPADVHAMTPDGAVAVDAPPRKAVVMPTCLQCGEPIKWDGVGQRPRYHRVPVNGAQASCLRLSRSSR